MDYNNSNLNENENSQNSESLNNAANIEQNQVDYSAATGAKEYIYSEQRQTTDNGSSVNFGATYANNNSQNSSNTEYKSSNQYNSQSSNFNFQKPTPKKSSKKLVFGMVALMLIVSLLSGTIGGYIGVNYLNQKSNTSNNGVLNYAPSSGNTAINISSDAYFAAAVNEKAKDSVVGISTTYIQKVETFFGRPMEQEVRVIGSGVVVTANGLILTNSHVIGDGTATSVVVSLTDNTTEEAKVLWYDKSLDLALIKIERTDLHAAELGDSDSLMIGEPVVAIGNPMSLDLNGTVTDGIISGLNRSITIDGVTIKPLIQTNASINPGNSGGPLFNAQGQVVGINTAKMSSAEGLGFSIPINTVIPMLQQITNIGKVSSVYIGFTGIGVADYTAKLGIELSEKTGIYVVEVLKDGPAYGSELKSGDIIKAIDSTELSDMNDLKRALYNYKDGDKVKLKISRNGDEIIIDITLKQKPSDLN